MFKYFLLLIHIFGISALWDSSCRSINNNHYQKEMKTVVQKIIQTVDQQLQNLIINVADILRKVDDDLPSYINDYDIPKDCSDIQKLGYKKSGVYTILPDACHSKIDVYCDLETDGGGWLVFQKRQDGSENFWREWADYKNGFGHPSTEYWLGNDKISLITNKIPQEFRVDLEDHDGVKHYAIYKTFAIAPEQFKYALTIGKYSGNAGDMMSHLNGVPFTTRDQDNDSWEKNCAEDFKGAWWYTACHSSNLNGLFVLGGNHTSYADGIIWHSLRGHHYSLKDVQLKIRPLNFKAN